MRYKFFWWGGIALNGGTLIFLGIEGLLLEGVSLVIAFNLIVLSGINRSYRWFPKTIIKLMSLYDKARNSVDCLRSIKEMTSDIKFVTDKIDELGSENFLKSLEGVSNEKLRLSILATHKKIVELRKKDFENTWISQGLIAISEIKHDESTQENYEKTVISTITKYVQAQQGGFFLLKGEGEEAYFELQASYAMNAENLEYSVVQPGEGMLGQVYYQKELACYSDLPGGFIKISSGLGEAPPFSLCIVPLMSEGSLYGALEIASFQKFSSLELEYLRKAGENIGYNLASMKSRRRTEALLKDSQSMAEELNLQKEELSQNVEELNQTQEHMRKKQVEMDAVLSSLSTVQLDLKGNVLSANEVFLSITGYTYADVNGNPYKNFISGQGNDALQYELMWNNILEGRAFSGEFRLLNKDGKTMWMNGNFIPILNKGGNVEKVMVITLFTTQEKEKLQEIQETLSGIKACFPMVEIADGGKLRAPSDLFLREIGIKRVELRRYTLQDIVVNKAIKQVEEYLLNDNEQPENFDIEIKNKSGTTRTYSALLMKLGEGNAADRKGLLILQRGV